MSKTIRIESDIKERVTLDELIEMQGELKSLSKEAFDKLDKEITETGFAFPIFVWDDNGKKNILDGHQRTRYLKQKRSKGYEIPPIPVVTVHAKDEKEAARRILQLVSQYGQVERSGIYEFMTKFDFSMDELKSSFVIPDVPLDLDGFGKEFFDEITMEPMCDEDEVPEPQSELHVVRGDVFILGGHRLMCGDATVITDLESLMGQEKASVWLSDPPYGINHTVVAQEKKQAKGYTPILNDDLQDEALREFIFQSISTSLPFMKEGFAFYMWHAMKTQAYFSQAAAAAGILFHRQIIWVKPQFVFGRGQYHWRHELCLMGWLQGNEPPFYGERNQSTVWEIGRENDKIHPTQKPVAIWEPAILNHTKPGEIIYEPFSGSGSNMIACEKNGRRCFGLELEPKYCSVILSRWAKYTGKDPVRESDGMPWSEINNPKT